MKYGKSKKKNNNITKERKTKKKYEKQIKYILESNNSFSSQYNYLNYNFFPIYSSVFYPSKMFFPNNQQEVINIVKYCYKNNLNIKMRGNRHTWNTIGYTGGILIDMRKLKRYSLVSDELITETGVTIKEILIFLKSKKRRLNYNGFIHCSVGGAISTDTHGSCGIYCSDGTFNSLITEIKYIDGKGIVNTITKKSNLFDNILCSLGQLCIILKVKISTTPFKMNYFSEKSFKFNNFNNKKLTNCIKSQNVSKFYFYINKNKIVSQHIKIYNNQKGGLGGEFHTKNILSEKDTDLESYYDIEYCMSIYNFIDFLKIIKKYALRKYKIGSRICFGKKNGLSPCKSEINIWVSLCISLKELDYINSNFEDYNSIINKIEKEALKNFNIYPHWGKINFFTNKEIKKIYGKEYNLFLKLKKKMDPKGIFNNHFSNRFFNLS